MEISHLLNEGRGRVSGQGGENGDGDSQRRSQRKWARQPEGFVLTFQQNTTIIAIRYNVT